MVHVALRFWCWTDAYAFTCYIVVRWWVDGDESDGNGAMPQFFSLKLLLGIYNNSVHHS